VELYSCIVQEQEEQEQDQEQELSGSQGVYRFELTRESSGSVHVSMFSGIVQQCVC
jgi:hypothetical protein